MDLQKKWERVTRWMQRISVQRQTMAWGLLLCAILWIAVTHEGFPMIPIGLLAVLCVAAWQWPFASVVTTTLALPLTGLMISIPIGAFAWGQRVVGETFDIGVGEWIAAALILTWGIRLLVERTNASASQHTIYLPLFLPVLGLIGAHLVSLTSTAAPDPVVVLKFVVRNILFIYIACVLVPVSFIRSERRLWMLVGASVLMGFIFSIDAVRSIFSFSDAVPALHRVRPLPWFGIQPLSGNHHALAELLLITAPWTFAFLSVVSVRHRRFVMFGGMGMAFMALGSFARSAWLACIAMLTLFAFTRPHGWMRLHAVHLSFAVAALLPLVVYMSVFSARPEMRGSDASRAILFDISAQLFKEHPFVGAGAGTTVSHVSRTHAFLVDFGEPLEAHGVVQKIAGETGLVGLAALGWFFVAVMQHVFRTWKMVRGRTQEQTYLWFVAALVGATMYQTLSVNFWTAKWWLPLGILLASEQVLLRRARASGSDFLPMPYV